MPLAQVGGDENIVVAPHELPDLVSEDLSRAGDVLERVVVEPPYQLDVGAVAAERVAQLAEDLARLRWRHARNHLVAGPPPTRRP